MVAFEIMYNIDQRRKGKEALMAVNLDMSKAYDRIEWVYLEEMMRRMGFHERWISLIMMCLTTVGYSVLINGEAKGKINPTRGPRQGDPISLYLFLICAEGLSAMLKKEEREGQIKGVARGASCLSHLLFADDNIVFCRASVEECDRLIKVLEEYEVIRGRSLTRRKPLSFLVKTLLERPKSMCNKDLGFKLSTTMRNT